MYIIICPVTGITSLLEAAFRLGFISCISAFLLYYFAGVILSGHGVSRAFVGVLGLVFVHATAMDWLVAAFYRVYLVGIWSIWEFLLQDLHVGVEMRDQCILLMTSLVQL